MYMAHIIQPYNYQDVCVCVCFQWKWDLSCLFPWNVSKSTMAMSNCKQNLSFFSSNDISNTLDLTRNPTIAIHPIYIFMYIYIYNTTIWALKTKKHKNPGFDLIYGGGDCVTSFSRTSSTQFNLLIKGGRSWTLFFYNPRKGCCER